MAANAAFRQADLNADGRVDINEFRNFVGQNQGLAANLGSSWESTAVGGGAGWAGGAGWGAGAGAGWGAGAGAGWGAGASGIESAAWQSSAGAAEFDGGYDASYAVGGGLVGGAASYEGAALAGDATLLAGGAVLDSSAAAVQQVHYATDAQGVFQDPNPHIIRRPAPGGVQTYTQHVHVRFLQPPPVPPPGPLIIREVRPPQPPVPPPLRLRQVAPPLPPPPPLVLRERPPIPPPVVASQTVIRRLPGIPVPPRSVIERLPAAPPRPRDIIIERWIPYGPQARRRTILQRAAPPPPYPAPRNVIIQYDQAQVRIVRQFHRLGVVQANPAAYVQTYGAHLLDAAALVAQARAAGVVEDISAPGFVGHSGGAWSQEGWGASSGLVGGAGLVAGGAELVDAGVAVGGGLSSSSVYESSGLAVGGAGWEGGLVAGGLGGGWSGSWGSAGQLAGGVAGADAAFLAADTNLNGTLDQGEFRNYLAQNL